MQNVETTEHTVETLPRGHFSRRRPWGLSKLPHQGGSNGTRTLTQTQKAPNEWTYRFKTGQAAAKIAGQGTRFIRAIVPGNNPFGLTEYEFRAGTGEQIIALNVWELREKLAIITMRRFFENIYASLGYRA